MNLGTAINNDLISIRDIKNRDIDIIFLGSWDSYKNRKDFLDKLNLLKEFGYKIYLGGNGKRRLTLRNILVCSEDPKYVLIFQSHQEEGIKLKVEYLRLWLVSAYLESENCQTCSFFEINKEFVSFSNSDEMIKKYIFVTKSRISS